MAVYLNWNTQIIEGDEKRLEGNLGESSLAANGNESASGEKTAEETGNLSEYFEKARLEKQKARDGAVATLKEAIAEESLSQTSRDSAAESIQTISTGALSETRIETLVKAKGYKECVALINDEGVNVIVEAPEEGLSDGDTIKIKDIAVGETNFSPSQVKIIEIK